MEAFVQYFIGGFATVLQPIYILYMVVGVSFGLILGFLPGMNGGMGIALMLPFTYHMDALTALVFLLSIYTGSLFGGAVTAIMINLPGAPSNIATVMEGYPMTLKGESNRAMGLALCSSVIGGLIGCICLLCIAEPMANFALKFGPAEMFMVVFFGLTVVGSLHDDIVKSLMAGCIGVLMGCVGISGVSGANRGAMGFVYLLDGFPLVPTLIGLVALPELYNLVNQKKAHITDVEQKDSGLKGIWHGAKEVFRHLRISIPCALEGVVVGIMPAAGASIAGILAYNQTKNLSKKREQFGTGIAEGIVCCETANNASEGGSLATMFVLGIPGSTASAILLGALMIQGWNPGPRLFVDHKDVIYTAFSSLFCQQFVMLAVGLVLCAVAAKIVKIPTQYLIPVIMVCAILGSFANRNTMFDALLMIILSAIGFLLKKNDFPVMPLILGVILGRTADNEFVRIQQAYDSFFQIFTQPIVVFLLAVSIISLVTPIVVRKRAAQKADK